MPASRWAWRRRAFSACRHVAHALVEDGAIQHGRRRRTVAFLLLQFPEEVADEHRAHVRVSVAQLG